MVAPRALVLLRVRARARARVKVRVRVKVRARVRVRVRVGGAHLRPACGRLAAPSHRVGLSPG